ncbi:hypothetical protein [Ruminococcus sp.]|jgi:hypothetical protein|uniref:hypothetical protein n=1 Tax=Ruminococcus sp. TaxID=41978 RepID=UPI001B6304EC|nr:hypothetical protein [Ruminococcus sp.]MBP5431953.1 hypothetical protein [Ruminococcus sp.]
MNNKKKLSFTLIALAAVIVSVIIYLIICSGASEETKAFMPMPRVLMLTRYIMLSGS